MAIRLEWQPNTEQDIAKYYIYRQVVLTGIITKIDEVIHPTHEYTDPNGNSDYLYFISAVDEVGNESGLAGPVRLPPSNDLCQLYDNFKNPEGDPSAGKTIKFKIISLPYDYSGYYWSGQEIQKVTDQYGFFEIFLPRAASVQVLSVEFGLNETITVLRKLRFALATYYEAL